MKNGQTKIAQYSQWDGYPSGQGGEILKFLRQVGLAKLEANLPRCRFITDEEAEQADRDIEAGTKTMKAHFPLLSRDHGAKVLEMIASDTGTEPLLLQDHSNFLKDGLFCEWAYLLDLDAETLTVYKGGPNVVQTYSIRDLPVNGDLMEKDIYAGVED